MSQEFRLKNIDDTKSYLLEQFICKKTYEQKAQKGLYNSSYFRFYNYWMYFNSSFASMIGFPMRITSFDIGLKIYGIAARIKKYKSTYKKKKKKHDKIVLLEKSKLNSIEVLISKTLID